MPTSHSWAAAICMLAAGVPAASAQSTPTAEALYQEGVGARQAGDSVRAIELLSRAAAAEPRNADVLLQRGLALGDAGRLDEAQADLRAALTLAPDYADVRLALARLALRMGNPDEAGRLYRERVAQAPDDAEAWLGLGDTLRAQQRDTDAREAYSRAEALRPGIAAGRLASAERRRFRLDINGSLSNLSNDLPGWREASVRLAYAATDRTTYSGGVDVSHRFDTTDTYLEGRADHQLSERLGIYGYAGGTPDAALLPEVALGAGGSLRLQPQRGMHATYATLDLRYAHYVTGNVWSLNPGLVQYLASDRLWLTARWINTLDERDHYLTGWSLRADWQAWARVRLLAGYANAPESSDGVTVRTRAFYGGLAYDLNDAYSIQVVGSREQRAGLYDRNSVTVGLTARF